MKSIFTSCLLLISLLSFSQDLTITGVTNTTTPLSAIDQYQTFSLSVTFKNAGIIDITNYSVTDLYLSTDNILSSGDTFIGIMGLESLAAGTSASIAFTTDQITIAPGTYYLILKADYSNTITETDETNNIYVSSGYVVNTPNVDFSFASLTYSSTTAATHSYIYPTYKIQNTGTTNLVTPTIYTSFYLSTDVTLDASDILLNYSSYATVGSTKSDNIEIPEVTPGAYYVIAHTDDLDKQGSYSETNETNNTAYKAFTIISSNIDLDIATTGEPYVMYDAAFPMLMIDIYIKNNGTTGVIGYTGDFYLSSDQVLDGSDYPLINQSLDYDSYFVGGLSTIHAEIEYDEGLFMNLPVGTFYVITKLNGDNAIPETNTNNNIAVSANTITIPPSSTPDISTASLNSSYNDKDTDLELNITFINNGASVFSDLTNYTVTITDDSNTVQYNNYQYQYLFLTPSQTETEQFSLSLNQPLAHGNYTIQISCGDPNTCGSSGFSLPLYIKQTSFSLNGNIQAEDGTSITQGKLYLYQKDVNGNIKFTQKTDPITNSNFSFQVDDQPYTLYFVPDPIAYPSAVPTILGETVVLKANSFITLNQDTTISLVILQIHPLAPGTKIISGTIDTGAANSRLTANSSQMNTASTFSVILLSESGVPVAITQTDANGKYEFINLPEDKYAVIVALELDQVTTNTPTEVDVTLHNAEVNFNLTSDVISPSTTILQLNQTIAFTSLPAKTFGDDTFSLAASSDSNLPLVYTSSDTNVALIVNNNQVTIVGAGTTTITASQSGDADYLPASNVPQSLIVNKADQSIQFGSIPSKQITDQSFNLEASSSSNLPVSFVSDNESIASINGTLVTIYGPGTVNITALQEGNQNYMAASSVTQPIVINQVTGIEVVDKELQVYPNPTKGILFLNSSIQVDHVTVTDAVGREENIFVNNLSIDMRNFETGLYFIKLQSKTGSRVLKVIKE